jgi:plasmid stabilization system protein ParE
MTRFYFSEDAKRDLQEIRAYLNSIEPRPDKRTVQSLLKAFNTIADYPYFGAPNSTLTRLLGTEVRSRLCNPYRIYYRLDRTAPEIFAILHTARDTQSIFTDRLQ